MTTDPDFRLLFESSPDILLVLLPDPPRYTMVGATRARHAVTHTTPEQIEGRGLFEVFPDDPADPDTTGTRNLRASLDRVLQTRAPDTMAVQKYDIPGVDGTFTSRYWSPRNLPVIGEDGTVRYLLHRVEDVTELVRRSSGADDILGPQRALEREIVARSRELGAANEALRDAAEQLRALDVAKTQFFSNVSHEFRTPLTLMLGPLEDALADRFNVLPPAHHARLRLAHDNALRLLKLVNALLDFSRLQAGRSQARFTPMDLARFTAELAGMFTSAVEKTALKLDIQCPALSEPVWVDRDMWEKIVLNLVSNAFKFTHEGRISVRVVELPACVLLEVADTGIGIPPEELPRIFERFHRIAGASGRTYEGTGIGLALVHELVELHRGRITAESTVGLGTTFRVEIPRGTTHLPSDALRPDPLPESRASREAAAHVAEAGRWLRTGPAPSANDLISGAEPVSRRRVLVADDNVDLRDYICSLLSPDYDVIAARDGLEALELVRAKMPDIVISDVMMPQLDGLGLAREIRRGSQTASIPVILLSARAGQEAAIEGLDSGSDDYLIKPFAAQELLARVRTHVELAHKRRIWIEELQLANRELDAFTYSVAHDLRAPLRGINGLAEILIESKFDQLDEEGRRYLQLVRDSGLRMAQLIDDLLELSRVTRQDVALEPVDLSALVRDVGRELGERHADRQVELIVKEGILADADPRLMRIVLENLLGNAWKFTAKRPRARVAFGADDSTVPRVYYVRDNGAGFDMAFADRLFGVFQRLHSAEEFEGTGVGLATVQRVILRHRGRVWAEGAPDGGACIYFTLGPGPGVE